MEYPGKLIFAMKEEIGNTDLFSGRKDDIEYFLKWVDRVKDELDLSIAVLARRKKGKTALVQRLYNVLFTINDPMVVPFYYKIREDNKSQLELANELYNALLCQYAAFETRDITHIKKSANYSDLREVFIDDKDIVDDIVYMEGCLNRKESDKAWTHAAYAGERISILKNIRIIQILDEFQYLDKYIYKYDDYKTHLPLCGTYHHVGASKISPVIVTGSYIAWLLSIIMKMTGRYKSYYLKNLPKDEAIAAVYNYSSIYKIPVTRESVEYIVNVTAGDVFYISQLFRSDYKNKDLTGIDSINDVLFFETRAVGEQNGEIAKMWFEYLYDVVNRVNDINGKKIILYLAKYGGADRTRKEILEDLQLNMTDVELEQKMDTFIKADILSYGQTRYRYKGLGDKMFEMVFRGIYQEEIDNIGAIKIHDDIKAQLKAMKGKVSYYKGIATEYYVVNRLMFACIYKTPLKAIVQNYIEGYELTEIHSLMKKRFSVNQENYIEVDIFLESRQENGNDFVIEVKNWEDDISTDEVNRFINKKMLLETLTQNVSKAKRTGYIFYSEKAISKEKEDMLKANNIMFMYGDVQVS